jgi:hypothetical protein
VLVVALGWAASRATTVEDPAFVIDHPQPKVNPTIPEDAEIPAALPATQIPIAFFDDFSWRSFLALNWPAVPDKRGVADTARKLGHQSPAVVWETWKAAYELFQPQGAQPSEWDSFEAISPCKDVACTNAGRVKQLASFSNFGPVLEDFNEAGFGHVPAGPLVAQNRTYVRYEVHMNKTQYNYIRGDPGDSKTALYLRQNLVRNPVLSFPAGSIEVKAAWREFRLPQEKDFLDRYYHVDALLVDRQTRISKKKTMGLVGFHIVQKTPTRPQWIWSTFEHVDNLMIGAGAPAKTRPTFNDPSQPQEGDKVNALPSPINVANPPQACPEPVQVVRWNAINDSTRKTNELYHSHALVKDTVWKNYELIATQWPSDPKAAADGKPFPPNGVANSTMETQFQSISCMSCHKNTTRTDFVWVLAIRAYPHTEQAVAPALKALRENRKQ